MILGCAFGMKADGYEMFIKKGLTWKEYYSDYDIGPAHPFKHEAISSFSLDNEIEFDGKTVLEVYRDKHRICCDECAQLYDSKGVEAYFWVDGDKVYFYSLKEKDPTWHLLFDFGLQPGDGCDPTSMIYLHTTYVVCDGVSTLTNVRQWDVINFTEWNNKEEFDQNKDDTDVLPLERGQWIRGLGSERGLSQPNMNGYVGGGWWLIEAKFNGELIYADYPAGVDLTSMGNLELAVEVVSGQLTVLGISGSAKVYSVDGKHVGSVKVDEPVSLPKGIYIVKSGNASRKVVL